MKTGLSLGGTKLGATALVDRPQARQVEPFGFDLHVGPKGSSKSLLAVHRARRYAQGMVKSPDGLCTCSAPSCPNEWRVYTNLRSTWKGHAAARNFGGGWAEPIDMAEQLLDTDSNTRHAVLLIDEGYQIADSRRAMLNTSLDIADNVTQSRKTTLLMIATGVSFDWFDNRIRGQARQVYQTWTPNKGVTTYASVTLLSTGHLAPWQRFPPPMAFLRWDTKASREYYNSWERIRDREELQRARRTRHIHVKDADGNITLTDVERLIDNIVWQRSEEGVRELDLDSFVAELVEVKKLPVSRSAVERQLGAVFEKITDGEATRFVIGSGMEMEALLK